LRSRCRQLLTVRGEADSMALAADIVRRLGTLSEAQRDRFFDVLARDFNPEPARVLVCAQAYADTRSAEALLALSEAAEAPRQELFRRINRAEGGTIALIQLRRALLAQLVRKPHWRAIEADLLHLLSSWFNPGFLRIQRVDWRSPAQLLEKVIQHEAVHAIDGWDDLRRRLQPDRRLFAFFHPQLPEEPLIFVEVALLPAMAQTIAPLIDKRAKPLSSNDYKVAVFYSISNCQPGLRGVSLGNFLIKRVAEELQQEWPQIKTFCTLSPIPGFAAWLGRLMQNPVALQSLDLPAATHERALVALQAVAANGAAIDAAPQALQRLVALYLVHATPTDEGDSVARFHLDNGARLERINPRADLSSKGLKQSAGWMVNYLYDLKKLAHCHERFVQGRVVHSRAVSALL
jgi:malonyl-CoA decarboxylase